MVCRGWILERFSKLGRIFREKKWHHYRSSDCMQTMSAIYTRPRGGSFGTCGIGVRNDTTDHYYMFDPDGKQINALLEPCYYLNE